MTKNRTPTPVYLDPGMHPGLEVKGLRTTCSKSNKILLSELPSVLNTYCWNNLAIPTPKPIKIIFRSKQHTKWQLILNILKSLTFERIVKFTDLSLTFQIIFIFPDFSLPYQIFIKLSVFQVIWDTLPALGTAPPHVKVCRWLTSYFPHSQFQVL